MPVVDFLRAKRDGQTHDPEDVRAFIAAVTRGEVPDYQTSAWLMAAFVRGLDASETEALTAALLHSGRVFDWSGLGRPSADKHSTGGVGDKISLPLAPAVAACGVLVPMVSGRGLGHTGGTLDKLESIPGFRTRLEPDAMRAQLDALGVVMVGQGPDLAPADGILYGLRDVTATVECEPFIVSSIVSKKIAEGVRTVVYDVKCGNGAFMKTRADASRLARRLVETTRSLGASAAALVTDMNEPLGVAVGNALEVVESAEVLRGRGPADVRELTIELGALMVERAGVERGLDAARARVRRTLDDGSAWEKFLALVRAQDGDPAAVERGTLARAPEIADVRATRAGTLAAIDTFALGRGVVEMGGGRAAKADVVDPRVGVEVLARIGDPVGAGDPLARVHVAADAARWVERIAACFTVGDGPVERTVRVLERID